MFLNGARSGRIFDIETVVNRQLIRDVYYPDMDVEAGYAKARADLIEETKGDFFPLIFHAPVAISLGKFSIKTDDTLEWEYAPRPMFPVGETDAVVAAMKFGDTWTDELVKVFWQYAEQWDGPLVSFNGRGFDLPVLELHALRLGLKIPKYFADNKKSFRHRYGRHIDLMDQLSNYGAARRVGKLDMILKFLGHQGKGAVVGADVGRLWAEGNYKAVNDYCCDDVAQTFEFLRKWEIMRGASGIIGSGLW